MRRRLKWALRFLRIYTRGPGDRQAEGTRSGDLRVGKLRKRGNFSRNPSLECAANSGKSTTTCFAVYSVCPEHMLGCSSVSGARRRRKSTTRTTRRDGRASREEACICIFIFLSSRLRSLKQASDRPASLDLHVSVQEGWPSGSRCLHRIRPTRQPVGGTACSR